MKRYDYDDKYTHLNEDTMFGFITNALGGGGDRGQAYPRSDAEDMSRGLRFIPGEVTLARREGKAVTFTQPCSHRCCWYWQFQDGSRTYYWERRDYEQIAEQNGNKPDSQDRLIAGPCPACHNPRTRGGNVTKSEVNEIIEAMKKA